MQDTMRTMTAGLRPGDKLTHFEVQEQLASGGMGIVWRGYDRLLNRHVAIKQIAERQSVDETFREQFRQEAALQKRVSQSHPNVVDVIDFIDDARGLFIVMEYVDGLSLDRALAQLEGPVEPLKALIVLRDVTQALEAIHAAGVIHRDLKPANILLPAGGGSAKVCDFGMATLMAEQDAMSLGTTQYMAPELLGGGEADGRADIYSLGMVAYEMLAGRPAYEQAFRAILRDQRNQAMRWMKWHTNTRITAPPLHDINEDVPEVLSDLVERMMAKDPSQRIASASQLLEAIRRHFSKSATPPAPRPAASASTAVGSPAAPSPAPAASPQQAPPTAPLPKKGKLVYILTGLIAVQTLGIGGYFWWQHAQEQQAAEAVVNDAEQTFAQALQLFNDGKYAEATPLFADLADRWGAHPKLGNGARGYELLSAAHQRMNEADAQLAANNYAQSAQIYGQADEMVQRAQAISLPDDASTLLNRLDRIDREIASRRSFVQQAIRIDEAIESADFTTARRIYKQLRDVSVGSASVLTPTEQQELGELSVRIEDQQSRAHIAELDARAARLIADGQFIQARTELNEAIERVGPDPRLTKRLADLTRQMDLDVAMREATEAEAAGNLPQAVAAYSRAHDIEAKPELSRKINSLRSQIAFNEGQQLESSGAAAAAAQKYQEAIAFAPHAQAEARLKAMKMANEKGSILASADTAFEAGDYQQAMRLYQRALGLSPDPETQARKNEATVRMHVQKADAFLRQGDLDAARAELNKALAIKPEDGRASELLSGLETRARYLALIEQADKLRAESQFAASKTTYQKAIDLARDAGIDAEEIVERKVDTEFDHLIAQARSAMELSLWVQARGLLLAARNLRPEDPRWPDLLAEVERHVDTEPN